MKIAAAPPPQLPKGVDDLKALALAAAAPPITYERQPFDLARPWTVRGRPLDEAAIALVELSVLIYEWLGTVRVRVQARKADTLARAKSLCIMRNMSTPPAHL